MITVGMSGNTITVMGKVTKHWNLRLDGIEIRTPCC